VQLLVERVDVSPSSSHPTARLAQRWRYADGSTTPWSRRSPGAFRWREMLEKGTHATIEEIAAAEKINASYVGRVLRLTLLAPDIVEAILGLERLAYMVGPTNKASPRNKSKPIPS
jgi:hypothetical protein